MGQFYSGANNTLITTLTAAPYAFTWTGVPQGTYALTARITDNSGDTVVSDPINVTVTAAVAQLYFIEVDHLDTPRVVEDATQKVVWRWDQQEPFGDSVADSNPSGLGAFDLPLRLPGQTYDQETGLHYNYIRDYNPALGRFGESDPIGLNGGLNTYAYGAGNPIANDDPRGQFIGIAVGVIVLGTAALTYYVIDKIQAVNELKERERQLNELVRQMNDAYTKCINCKDQTACTRWQALRDQYIELLRGATRAGAKLSDVPDVGPLPGEVGGSAVELYRAR